jgi:hypothetical protein
MLRTVYRVVAAGLLVSAAVAVAVVAWTSTSDEAAQTRAAAAQPASPTPRATPAPTAPGAASPSPSVAPVTTPSAPLPLQPDTSQPGWYRPYLEAERGKPRFDQVVNGITVGPTAFARGVPTCPQGLEDAPVTRAAGTPLQVEPAYLPEGAREDGDAAAVVCQGVVAAAQRLYSVAADPARGSRGGRFSIVRWRGEPRAPVTIAAERWTAGAVGGRPAAIATPILPIGLGESAVVAYSDGIVTVVQAANLPIEEVRRITEGVFR